MSNTTHDDATTLADVQRKLESQIRQVSNPLSRAGGWMKFVAVLSVISVIPALIYAWWYLLYLWLPVWTAVVLFQAATHVNKASLSGSETELSHALDRLRLYFKISGVVALIGLIFGGLSLVFAMPCQQSP